MAVSSKYFLLVAVALLVLLPGKAQAFGAGNIASISKIEGKNWRHGDIEDMLATVACLRGHKWKSMMIKRVYFGNWLRDYSQAVDTATLARVQAETIRVLVWILSFMSFGYATGEFEVTAERLGVYRPEEHIDNPKDYADNEDARKHDPRLRGPVSEAELAVDPETGMKNYIANERGGWATSSGYVKFSFARAIHFGRMYTHGPSGQRGRDEDLAEALRCLGQGLHCLEDFGAHTNYTELVLRELGHTNVFPHVGTQTGITLRGKHVYPLVTGTFGGVDFFHSVLGEATDHFTQSEIDQMDTTLSDALTTGNKGNGNNACNNLTNALGKIPGTGGLIQEALSLQAASDAQAASNAHGKRSGGYDDYSSSRGGGGYDDYSSSRAGGPGQHQQPPSFDAPPGSVGGPPGPDIPGTNTDPTTIIPKIYPILLFRDKVVRNISAIVSKIPGLEKAIENITEHVTLFVLSLLAPFIMPIIQAASKQLKLGSSAVVESAAKHQFEVWTNPHSSDPTHSMLSKDHFSNILNEPAGQVAVVILQYVAPRVIYAWDHPDVPVDQVLNDCMRVFHHPSMMDPNCEVHRNMYDAVRKWAHEYHGKNLNDILSSESVRAGKNHHGDHDHSHGAAAHGAAGVSSFQSHGHGGGHSHSGGGGYPSSHSHGGGQSHGQGHSGSGGAGGLLGGILGGSGGGGHSSSGLSSLLGGSGGGHSSGLGALGNKLSPGLNLFSKTREGGGDDFRQPSPSPSPQPSGWRDFKPYQSSYAGGESHQGAEYNAPAPGGYSHGYGEYSGGHGAEPAYSVPTAYQQGYENYGPGPGGYGQLPPQQQGGYGGGYGDSYNQQQSEGGGRKWGEGGGNSGW